MRRKTGSERRKVVACYVSRDALVGEGVTVGNWSQILGASEIGDRVEIGSNVIIGHPSKLRVEAGGHLREGGGSKLGADSVIRSNTVIYEGVCAGAKLQTAHGVIIREEVVLDELCSLGNHAVVEPRARLGRNVRVQSFVSIAPDAWIGDNVFLGPNVILTNKRYMAGVLARAGKTDWETIEGWERLRDGKSVIIEDDVRIGSNAVLLVGIKLSRGCAIAAGSVVMRDVPEFTLVAGAPARPVRKIDPATFEIESSTKSKL